MQKQEAIGKYYGYPDCCIDWFMNNRMSNWKPLTEKQELVHNSNGFIPCPLCTEKITAENIESLISNRICKMPYPGEGEEKELDEYLVSEGFEVENDEVALLFDPSNDKVLGVFGDNVHVDIDSAVLVIPKTEYLRVWNNWLEGKREYCENHNHYCGVMGYVEPEDYDLLEDVVLNRMYEDETLPDGIGFEEVSTPSYYVKKFSDIHDFEHG